jgi:hypothetical protein
MCHIHNKPYPFGELRPPCATDNSACTLDYDRKFMSIFDVMFLVIMSIQTVLTSSSILLLICDDHRV